MYIAELPHVDVNDRERALQIEGRSAANCLVFIDGVACCSIHETPLDEKGVCGVCEDNAAEAAYEQHLAYLERLADCIAETDDDSTLEENIVFYGKKGKGF